MQFLSLYKYNVYFCLYMWRDYIHTCIQFLGAYQTYFGQVSKYVEMKVQYSLRLIYKV